MRTKFAFLLLLLTSYASGTAAVTGRITTPSSSAPSVPSFVQFELLNCGSNPARATQPLEQATLLPVQRFYADTSGNVAGNLVRNDQIACGNDTSSNFYQATLYANNSPIAPSAWYRITGSTFDLNVATPITVHPVIVPPTGDGIYIRKDGGNSPVVGSIEFQGNLLVDCGKQINGILNAACYSGADIGAQINAAHAALSAAGGEIYVPAGTYSFSTKIALSKNVILRGAGTGFNALYGTRLNYTGSGVAIEVSGTNNQSTLKDFSLDNTGTGTVGIDVLTGVNNLTIERVTSYPQVTGFSTAGIRLGSNGLLVDVTLRDVYIRNNAIGLQALNVSAHLVLDHARFIQNTSKDVQIGSASGGTDVVSFHAVASSFEGAGNTTSVSIERGTNVSFSDCYFENDGTGYAIDVPSTATIAKNISVRGGYFVGTAFAHTTTYAIDVNLASADLEVSDSYFVSYANPGYIARLQNARKFTAKGNDADFAGASVASTTTNVVAIANILNSINDVSIVGQDETLSSSLSAATVAIGGGTAITTSNATGTGNLVKATTPAVTGLTTDTVVASGNIQAQSVTVTTGNLQFNTGLVSNAGGFAVSQPTGKISAYALIATAGLGVVGIYGTPQFLTAQTANLAATNVYASAPAGSYRVCASARTTTSGTGTTATLNIIWTDEGGVKTDAVGTWALNSVTVTGQINKCEYIHAAASTAIQVSVTAGTYGTSAYALDATAERLN